MAIGDYLSPVVRQYIVVFTVNMGILNFGLAIGWPSSVIVKLADLAQSPLSHTVTSTQASWIANIISLSGIIALVVAAKLVDCIGRKYCFVIAGVLRITNVLFLLFATKLWMIIFGRFISGLSDGFIFGACAMYSAEIANKEIRGSLGTLIQIFSAAGILIGLSVGPFLSYTELNLLFLTLAVVSTVPIMFLPDSPYFLYKKGDKENARKMLIYFRGSETLASDEMKEYDLIVDEPLKISQILRSKEILKSLAFAMLIGGGVQFTGFINLQYFLQPILISTGSRLSPEIASVALGCVQLVASAAAAFVTDRFKRKHILFTGLFGNMIGLIGFGIFFHLTVNEGFEVVGFLSALPIISYIVCNIFNCGGITSIMWTMISELFDGRARGIGVAFGVINTNIFILITGLGFPIVTEAVGPVAPFWIFTAMTAVVTAAIMLLVPETKDKTFAEIQRTLAGDVPQIEL